jgi:hypothetical protein
MDNQKKPEVDYDMLDPEQLVNLVIDEVAKIAEPHRMKSSTIVPMLKALKSKVRGGC